MVSLLTPAIDQFKDRVILGKGRMRCSDVRMERQISDARLTDHRWSLIWSKIKKCLLRWML